MDRGAKQASVHGVTKSRARLFDYRSQLKSPQGHVYHPLVRRIRFLSNLILLPHSPPPPNAFARPLLRRAEHSVPGLFLSFFLIDGFVFYVFIYFWVC